jgi:chromate reductase, NAD(P)H dehydrogenase (quinone)
MAAIVGISGSLRKDSRNAALLRSAADMTPEDTEIEIVSIAGIPPYDADIDREEDRPEAVERLRRSLAETDGLLLVTPEYNNGIPGVLKNAIDWASRPADEIPEVFGDLPVALAGVGGRGGTRLSQASWLPVLRTLGARLYPDRSLFAARGWELFDGRELTDGTVRELLEKLVRGFVAYCERLPRRRG